MPFQLAQRDLAQVGQFRRVECSVAGFGLPPPRTCLNGCSRPRNDDFLHGPRGGRAAGCEMMDRQFPLRAAGEIEYTGHPICTYGPKWSNLSENRRKSTEGKGIVSMRRFWCVAECCSSTLSSHRLWNAEWALGENVHRSKRSKRRGLRKPEF